MNNIINFYKNDGSVSNELNFDYCQISLSGKHAKKIDDDLDGKGNLMLVSQSDANLVANFKWHLGSTGYPSTYGTFDGSVKFSRPVTLHRILIGQLNEGLVVDHISRDKLDNRRENLRICTALENSYNRSKLKGQKYKGVTKHQTKNGITYIASISKDGVKHEIKDIQTEEDAARIYDMMAEQLFGNFAGKNFN
jgi:hypothetical protein